VVRPADPILAPAVHRALVTAADGIERDVDRIAAEMAAVLHRDVPELLGDPRSIETSERAGMEIIRSFLRALRRGEPVESAEPAAQSLATARALARSGRGLLPLMRLCHVGHGFCLTEWDEQLGALGLDSDTLLGATRAVQRLTFGWVDAFTRQLADEYERELQRLEHSGQTQRALMIRSLLRGDAVDEQAASRALGHDLARHHTALVLWTQDDRRDAPAVLARAAEDFAAQLGGARPLLLSVAGTVTWAWISTTAPPVPALGGAPRGDGVSAAVGEAAFGATGFRASHRDAEDAFRVALLGRRRPGSLTAYRRVELAALLSADLERTRRFVRAQLGALAGDDDEHARLRATLRVYLEEHGSRQATAERLGVHANTVGNRVRACQRALGAGGELHRVELHVALTLSQMLGSSVLGEPGDR
jgi:DNA-binding PucR family transcriptional regulator